MGLFNWIPTTKTCINQPLGVTYNLVRQTEFTSYINGAAYYSLALQVNKKTSSAIHSCTDNIVEINVIYLLTVL